MGRSPRPRPRGDDYNWVTTAMAVGGLADRGGQVHMVSVATAPGAHYEISREMVMKMKATNINEKEKQKKEKRKKEK